MNHVDLHSSTSCKQLNRLVQFNHVNQEIFTFYCSTFVSYLKVASEICMIVITNSMMQTKADLKTVLSHNEDFFVNQAQNGE